MTRNENFLNLAFGLTWTKVKPFVNIWILLKGIKRLGRTSAVHRAHDQYLTHIKTKADKDEISPLVTSVENTETSGAESSGKYAV